MGCAFRSVPGTRIPWGGDWHSQWIRYAAELASSISASDATKWGKWAGKASVSAWANEGVGYACSEAYSNVDGKYITSTSDNDLESSYYASRLKIVNLRLQQAGVRLASTLLISN